MTLADILGTIGVSILLGAYFLNLLRKIKPDGFIYTFLNFLGAGIALMASVLLNFVPFIILEAVWTLISLYAIINFFKKGKIF